MVDAWQAGFSFGAAQPFSIFAAYATFAGAIGAYISIGTIKRVTSKALRL
jgi:hypothetical protein